MLPKFKTTKHRMGRYYTKSLALIVFTLVSYLITRWLPPTLSESEEIARRLQIQKLQGNVIIQQPEGDTSTHKPHRPLKVKLSTTTTRPSNKDTVLHSKDKDTSLHSSDKETNLHSLKDGPILNRSRTVSCSGMQNAKHFNKIMEVAHKTQGPQRRRLPTVLVIGAKKSGTGALMHFMGIHPNITSDWGEAHYFDDDNHYKTTLKGYMQQMPRSLPTQITIEKTPYYFVDEKVPPRVKCFNASVKLILILRDPVQRLISDYVHERFHGIKLKTNLSENLQKFEDLVIDKKTGEVNSDYEPVKVGDYYMNLERWLKYFPRKQFLVLDGESFLKNPLSTLREVESFLQIPKYFTTRSFKFDQSKGYYCLTKTPRKGDKCMPPDKGRKHTYPKVQKEILTKLAYYYRPHNEKLFQLIGKTFSWK